MKKGLIYAAAFLWSISGYSQDTDTALVTLDSSAAFETTPVRSARKMERADPVYRLKPAVDIPLTLATGGFSAWAFTKIYSKESSTLAEIAALNKEDINGFDRWGADVYSEKAATSSDYFFYGAMPMPILLMLDKDIRKDAAKIGFLYLETMSITGLLYTGAVYMKDRYRPYTYNPNAPMDVRTGGGAKNSFFAGHVALVGTSTFFVAKVFGDYHPTSKLKPVLYGIAVVATGGTGYLRHRGGKHFPSDIIIGTAVGTLSGILVPHFHKNKLIKNEALSITPFAGRSNGLSLTYKF
jgi:membrane-associated phospholipid phosphatase